MGHQQIRLNHHQAKGQEYGRFEGATGNEIGYRQSLQRKVQRYQQRVDEVYSEYCACP